MLLHGIKLQTQANRKQSRNVTARALTSGTADPLGGLNVSSGRIQELAAGHRVPCGSIVNLLNCQFAQVNAYLTLCLLQFYRAHLTSKS